jgi:hypothetical protein
VLSRFRGWLCIAISLVVAGSASTFVCTTATAVAHESLILTTATNPSANIVPSPAYPSVCQSAPTGASCQNAAIAALNNGRYAMGLPAYNLPIGFQSLSTANQFLALSNLDRQVYGLTPISGLNASLNAAAAVGVATDKDPSGPSSVEGNRFTAWASNWAAGWASPLYTYYEWMYDDGYGSSNIDCTSPSSSGCWGHRASTLHNFGNGLVLMGVGVGSSPHYHAPAFTELYEAFAPGASISYQPLPSPAPIALDLTDVSGDGKADVVNIYPNEVTVQPSSGSSFASTVSWSSQPFYGTRSTTLADVNGDGRADAVAVNGSSLWVMLSTGSGFGAPQLWSSQLFYGAVRTYFADVNGDGKADAVAVNGVSVWVMLSTGWSFGAPQLWSSSLFYGAFSTLLTDVNGDGEADLVAINGPSVWVMLSTATGFSAPRLWSSKLFYGTRTTMTADVNGDGKADAVAVNDSSVWVMLAGTNGFGVPQLWASGPFYGSRATLAADVNGDRKVDVIAVNAPSLFVEQSSGTSLGLVASWF